MGNEICFRGNNAGSLGREEFSMHRTGIASLHWAGRNGMAWGPTTRNGVRSGAAMLLIATLPAAGIIGLAAAWLLAVL